MEQPLNLCKEADNGSAFRSSSELKNGSATKRNNGATKATLEAKLVPNGTDKAGTKKAREVEDWLWTYQEEPHRTRRQQIIKAHPEVGICSPEI